MRISDFLRKFLLYLRTRKTLIQFSIGWVWFFYRYKLRIANFQIDVNSVCDIVFLMIPSFIWAYHRDPPGYWYWSFSLIKAYFPIFYVLMNRFRGKPTKFFLSIFGIKMTYLSKNRNWHINRPRINSFFLLTDTERSEKVRYRTGVNISVHFCFAKLYSTNF